MAEYIERDILIKNIEQETMSILFTKSTALKYVRESPAADVAEVRHGRWIDKGWDGDHCWQIDGRGNCWHIFQCSNCEHNLCGLPKTKYCPNCGALMKEDEHEVSEP